MNRPKNPRKYDGREPGDWDTRYKDLDACHQIFGESAYLVVLLLACMIIIYSSWHGMVSQSQHGQDIAKISTETRYIVAWASGVLGGTVFTVKWLYRSVAREIWHKDRLLWRLFAPHMSGALAFFSVALISSGLVSVLDGSILNRTSATAGISFLVGYFSDSTIAKLSEIADTLFGARSKEQSPGSQSEELQKTSSSADLASNQQTTHNTE